MRASMNKKERKAVFIFFFTIKYNVAWEQWYDMKVIFYVH